MGFFKRWLDRKQEQMVAEVERNLALKRIKDREEKKKREDAQLEAEAMHERAIADMLTKACPNNDMIECRSDCVFFDAGEAWVDSCCSPSLVIRGAN